MGKSRLFLLELTICLLFFAISAAVCASAFGKAAVMSRDAKALSWACMVCQGEAERFAAGGDVEALSFDGAFQPVPPEQAVYALRIQTVLEETGLERGEITVMRGEAAVYGLTVLREGGEGS